MNNDFTFEAIAGLCSFKAEQTGENKSCIPELVETFP